MRLVALSSAGLTLASMIVWGACSGDDSNPTQPTGDAGPTIDSAGPTSLFTLGVPCTDLVDSIYVDPGTLPAVKGLLCDFRDEGAR